MDLKGKLRKGLHIFGSDNRDYGTIDRYDDRYAYVGERRIPVTAFERMDNDRLYLSKEGHQYFGSATDQRLGDSGEIRVPIRGEEAFATKEAVVTGEVVIDRDVKTERQTVSDTVRKERVDIDENWNRDRGAFEKHFGSRRSGMGTAADTRTFADAEPNYRRGYEAAYDDRYAGRSFNDVEPDLRRSHSGNESWEHLREEIREGFDRGRRSTTTERRRA